MLSPDDMRAHIITLGRTALHLLSRDYYDSLLTNNEESALLAIDMALVLLKRMRAEERAPEAPQWTLP